MRISRLVAALACILTASTWAQDLTVIARKIAREPVYTTTPRFCLLAFGAELQTRVWLTLDGGVLYVDRNANGDLTDDGPPVPAKNRDQADDEDGDLWFELGDIPDGKLTHKNLRVSVQRLDRLAERKEEVKEYLAADPHARGYSVAVEVETPGWKGAGAGGRLEQEVFSRDVQGFLKFADKPENAPILHFGGPWQLTIFGRGRLKVGRTADVVLGIGTPGLGPGTTAYVGYEGVIPENVRPTVEIKFPPVRPGGAPVRELYELKGRC